MGPTTTCIGKKQVRNSYRDMIGLTEIEHIRLLLDFISQNDNRMRHAGRIVSAACLSHQNKHVGNGIVMVICKWI